jgi:DNA topoisomerase I
MTKFKTLEHNGPLFPEAYEYKNKFYVNGIKLPYFAEDMLWHWAVLGEDYRKDKVYQKNFAATFLKNVPAGCPKTFPEGYEQTIAAMQAENEVIKAAKKLANTKEAREAKKAATEKLREQYGWALLDGKKQPIMMYTVEPEGIYVGRGDCPARGMWKYAVLPEDVTINFAGDESKIPQPPVGHKWKAVIADRNNMATCLFDVYIGEDYAVKTKGFGFAATSDTKQNGDKHKFEKAQQLAKDWNKIEKWIDDGVVQKKQEAVIAWLILRTGIRVGTGHDELWENGTVGASTLLVKNVKLNGTDFELNFLGKDSVPFKNQFTVTPEVAAALTEFLKNKKSTDKLFDKASAGSVNEFLKECLPYCTAKLFRTAYGTKLLAEELQKAEIKKGMPEWKIRSIYDNACLVVSTKLNHQKNVAKNYATQMDKTDENIKKAKEAEKAKRDKVKAQMAKLKKQAIACKKRYEGEELKELLDVIKAKGAKLDEQLKKAEQRVEKLEANKDLKKATKNIALGTAKANYSSPLVAYSFCKDLGVDIGIIYNKSQQKKFSWAANASTSFWKKYPN